MSWQAGEDQVGRLRYDVRGTSSNVYERKRESETLANWLRLELRLAHIQIM
jgi:hypothetical protein